MTDIPILFTPAMIAAVDDGRKTQTRRMETRAEAGDWLWIDEVHYKWGRYVKTGTKTKTGKDKTKFVMIPCGRSPMFSAPNELAPDRFSVGWHKRSPLFMEKIYARKWLRVTSVHEERLQDISEDDAIAEGCTSTALITPGGDDYNGLYAAENFEQLWDSINGADPAKCWAANPMVKVIKFEVKK